VGSSRTGEAEWQEAGWGKDVGLRPVWNTSSQLGSEANLKKEGGDRYTITDYIVMALNNSRRCHSLPSQGMASSAAEGDRMQTEF
jgi:hypothetical protein